VASFQSATNKHFQFDDKLKTLSVVLLPFFLNIFFFYCHSNLIDSSDHSISITFTLFQPPTAGSNKRIKIINLNYDAIYYFYDTLQTLKKREKKKQNQ